VIGAQEPGSLETGHARGTQSSGSKGDGAGVTPDRGLMRGVVRRIQKPAHL
jgi:hypothetical protein